jgi:hypothetical protein
MVVRVLKRVLKKTVIVLAVFTLLGLALSQFFGLRVVLDGGGTPRLRFVEGSEAQAARIEAHRAAQRATAAPASVPSGVQPPTEPTPATGVTETPPAPTIGEAARSAPTTPVAPAVTGGVENALTAALWPDFRGSRRDGVYRGGRIRTDWPASGLTPVWRQPAGGGYASFVVAGGLAFTIEQRGPREVVAAYDVATGREVWTNAWEAEFRESMGGDGPSA